MNEALSSSWGIYILAVIIIPFAFDLLVEGLNLCYRAPALPKDLEGFYDREQLKKSKAYQLSKLKAGLFQTSFFTAITLSMLPLGGFQKVYHFATQVVTASETITGLVFLALLGFGSSLLQLPFKIYATFVIEEKFGFNRSTWKTFWLDQIKGSLLALALGGPILYAIVWCFEWGQSYPQAWIFAWLGMTVFSITLLFISPLIMGWFNKYESLEDGELKQSIEQLAKDMNFEVSGLYKMDGSKRSSKANAFFAGFGKFRRIALFDTLIEKLSTAEVRAVLAHEIGHCKHHHIPKQFIFNSLTMGLSFYLVQTWMVHPPLFEVFQIPASIPNGLFIVFGFVLTPLNTFTSLISNAVSRRFEYQADHYAATQAQAAPELISALKKLSHDSLSDLQPHPLKAFVEHSHPTLIERSHHLQNIS